MSPKTTPKKTTSRRSRRKPTSRGRKRPAPTAAGPPALAVTAVDADSAGALSEVVPPVSPIPDALPAPLPAEVADIAPEIDYAARALPPEPERPWPGSRRAVFFDVENTSHAPHVERTLRHLGL